MSKCRERCQQELEELRKHQTEQVQLLLQQQEEKEQELKAENERVLSLLLQEHESQEALMLAKHKDEEIAARESDELKTDERNASLSSSAPSQPKVPECPVGNLTKQIEIEIKVFRGIFRQKACFNRPKVVKEMCSSDLLCVG